MQIWGGHGYIKQNAMEQIVRDARIAPVWEGTTGIQACHGIAAKPNRCFAGRMSPAACVTRHCTLKVPCPACVQALDLLGRKVMLQKIKPLNKFTSEIYRSSTPPPCARPPSAPFPLVLLSVSMCALQARIAHVVHAA